jgi:hypothetical protein
VYSRLDVVVIRNRDDGPQSKLSFDLFGFEFMRFPRREWRRPVDLAEIEIPVLVKVEPAEFAFDDVAADREFGNVGRQPAEILLRIHRVAVQRDAGAKLTGKASPSVESVKQRWTARHRRLPLAMRITGFRATNLPSG